MNVRSLRLVCTSSPCPATWRRTSRGVFRLNLRNLFFASARRRVLLVVGFLWSVSFLDFELLYGVVASQSLVIFNVWEGGGVLGYPGPLRFTPDRRFFPHLSVLILGIFPGGACCSGLCRLTFFVQNVRRASRQCFLECPFGRRMRLVERLKCCLVPRATVSLRTWRVPEVAAQYESVFDFSFKSANG